MTKSLEHSALKLLSVPLLFLLGLSIGLALYFKMDFLEGLTLTLALFVPSLLALITLYNRFFTTLAAVAVQLDSLANEEFTVWQLAKYKKGRVAELKHDLHSIAKRIMHKRQEYAQNENFIFEFINELNLPVVVLDSQEQVYHHNSAASHYYQKASLVGASLSELGLNQQDHKWQLNHNNQRYKVSSHSFARGPRNYRLLVYISIEQSLRSNEKEAWQKLVRVLNHEVRNSLTPIYSMAQSLQEITEPENELAHTMQSVIEKRAEHLLGFVASYSKLSQLPKANLAAIQVTDFVKRLQALFPAVTIQVKANGALWCDSEQLEQALLNLVKNAEQANALTKQNEVLVVISKPQNWHIEVYDKGEGIKSFDNLFVPFYSTKPEGSGIGLVLSRELIRNQGGELTLSNRLDESGAVACIALPNK
jgi:two-component system nitrogen regulation sensor histidine kinase NtrY